VSVKKRGWGKKSGWGGVEKEWGGVKMVGWLKRDGSQAGIVVSSRVNGTFPRCLFCGTSTIKRQWLKRDGSQAGIVVSSRVNGTFPRCLFCGTSTIKRHSILSVCQELVAFLRTFLVKLTGVGPGQKKKKGKKWLARLSTGEYRQTKELGNDWCLSSPIPGENKTNKK
jgi:hypothetical protein